MKPQIIKKINYLLLLLLLPSLLQSQKNDWILKKDREDVKVYYRESEASKIKELRMVYTLDARLSSVVALLEDAPNFANWVYALKEASLIEQISPYEQYFYNEVDFPWPLDNRDLIAHNKTIQNPNSKKVTMHSKSAHWKMKKKENLVRISTLEIIWHLFPQPNGTTKVDYFLKSDPAGNIPAWMVNLALDNGPLQTLKAMRKELKRAKYKNIKLNHIKE